MRFSFRNGGNPSAEKRLWTASLLILFVALSARLGLFAFSDLKKGIYRVETDHIALSLARGAGYGNPFPCATGPTAFYPPLYPSLIAIVYRTVGTGLAGEHVKSVLHLIVISLCLALLPLSSRILTGQAGPGLIAGLLGALMVFELVIELHGREMGIMSALVLASALLFAQRLRESEPGWTQGLQDGSLYGMGLLTGSHLLPVLLVSSAILVWRRRLMALKYVLSVFFVAFLCLLPWIVRNRVVFGQWIPLRSNFWLEMQISNNDQAKTDVVNNLLRSEGRRHHPFTNSEECQLYARLGEPAYMERKRELFLGWLKEHPLQFLRMSLVRMGHFWFPATRSQLAVPQFQWLITVLGWIGLWRMRKQGVEMWQWFAILWIFYPLIYYFVQSDFRYRYPVQWTLLLCAGWTAANIEGRSRNHRQNK